MPNETAIYTVSDLRKFVRTAERIYAGGGILGCFRVTKKATLDGIKSRIEIGALNPMRVHMTPLGWYHDNGTLFLHAG